MEKLTTIDLIAESPEAHGVYETPETTARTVIAEVRSITMAEFYRAKSAGITPELVFVLADYTEYGGEKLIQFEGEPFHVVRTYIAGQTIEIYAERADDNASNQRP